jgi:hypothetical protein
MRATVFTWVMLSILVCGGSRAWAQDAKESPEDTLPVSASHALFGKQCNLCHEPFRGASEKLCLGCHAGPLHNAAQDFVPGCLSCHVEHKGQEELAKAIQGQCVTCHADVKTKGGAPLTIAKTVTDFVQQHPQFALTVATQDPPKRLRLDERGARQMDRSNITFPHEEHLKAGLKSPKGPVQLGCKDCHVPSLDGKHMAPVTYLARCQSCHALNFDPQFPNRVVPHGSQQNVRAYLVMSFSERRGAPAPAPPSVPAIRGRLTRPVLSVAPLNVTPGVAQQVSAAEKYLYTTTCNKCHVLEKGSAPVPLIVDPAIPAVWFSHARFAHRAHRMLECVACHTDVATSKKATDVLVPGIQLCRECHRAVTQEGPVAQHQNSASTQCVSCHVYHDKAGDVDWNGPFTVQRVLTEGVPKKTKAQSASGSAQP